MCDIPLFSLLYDVHQKRGPQRIRTCLKVKNDASLQILMNTMPYVKSWRMITSPVLKICLGKRRTGSKVFAELFLQCLEDVPLDFRA